MPEDNEDFLPRDYQVALRQIALEKNSIIYLPTGSGKTFIAILVLKHLQKCSPKYTEGGKISFVVVNTVALVDQHAKCIEKRTNLEVGKYSGDMSLDFWPKAKWYEEFDKSQVFVMTVQILVNLTNQNFLDLNKVNLIVFDECHRGVSDQPMRQLCKSLKHVKEQPRILGLTATLLNGNCKPDRVLAEVEKLETTYHSQVATVDGLTKVTGYSTNPKEHIQPYSAHILSNIEVQAMHRLDEIITILLQVKDPHLPLVINKTGLRPLTKDDGLKKLNNIIIDIEFHIKSLGIYGGHKAMLAHMIQIERMKKHCDDMVIHQVLSYVQTMLSIVMSSLEKYMENFTETERILQFSSDKVKQLINIFDEYRKTSNEELCCLIFTKRRFTAKVIFYILSSLSKNTKEYSYIRPNFIVGYNSNPYNDTRESLYTSKKNREVLHSFDNKETTVLCSSNVLEEGVDISTCSLVIKFDAPEEYRSYIQSKGRARHPSSLYYMMVDSADMLKFKEKYMEFQEVEKRLQDLLVGMNKWRQKPSALRISNMYNEDELPPYYVNGPRSAKVDMVSAISLLSQYCNSLPCDKFTTLSPELYYEEKTTILDDLTRVTIILPTICPLTAPIVGRYMKNLKSAKRAAALLACEQLHKIGELDDHLLPKKYDIANEDVGFLFKHYPEVKETMAGTNKNKRTHKKQVAAFLKGPVVPQKPAWLHIINLQPIFGKREELNYSTFYDMYVSDICYGFLTPNQVPTICDFPIYVTLGTINVNLKVNVATPQLSEADIAIIREYNYLVYNDIVRSLKHREFLISDNGDDAETMMMVPVNKRSGKIDFDILNEHKAINPTCQLTVEDRLQLKVTQEDYLRKIVSPWYRDMGDYIVTEVSLNKSAKTIFPNEQFGTYEDYYREKHDVRLLNPEQPLLYVKHLTKKTNFIKPQGAQAKRKKEKNYEDLEIHLIPELVVKQEFPAALWIHANLLPTLLSRFSFLFRLEEFRLKMAHEMNIPENSSTSNKSLELDEYLLNYVPYIEQSSNSVVNVLVPESKNQVTFQSLSVINRDYAKKMLELEYPWNETEEPKDVERDIDVTILDIDYYEKFLSKSVTTEEYTLKNDFPKQQKDQLALTYFKDYEEKPIQLLDAKILDSGPPLCLIYKAMTTAKANDIVNMERLETLGDSFLKLFCSLYVYAKFPRFSEGLATSLKGRLVSNKNLYYLACKKNLGGLMKVGDLQISDWLAPGFKIPDLVESRIDKKETSLASLYFISVPQEEQISGILSEETVQTIQSVQFEEDPSEEGLIQEVASLFKCNYVGDKTVADCVEALLGAYFQTCGIEGGLRFVEWIGIIPKSENLIELLDQPPQNPVINDKATLADINYHIPDWDKIERDILGYHFKNRAFLLQALTHASYTPNRITQSYEKLEFVGDAILDFLVTCHIFEACGNLDPGDLTDLRSALVNNNTFASLVVRNNLHKYLLMINAKLQGMIDRFAGYIESKKFEIDDEVLILLEETDAVGLNIAEYIDVPKVLGDIFEALAAAVYLDSGKDLQEVWRVFHRLMWKEIESFSAKVPKNLIRRLYEWSPNPHPTFGDSIDAGQGKVMVPLQFMLNGRRQQVYGFGSNKMMAKKAAAKLALRQLC
ncbi:endoribonuclease Dicer isoform X2 [Dendroctonus ponderosae]|uniref:endoribonuclease Dicer isoform X2 n=1 Tax=Dendroctonus ponderosae TaxID=77166 RepID=UPI002034E08F|nr:endoribonuclease Dicer isoform X2 [Dendroctonus ponderosae]